ncbi:MAG: magnesium transporter [Candidatus Niyogibacteria bacterium]|nr:MAG: magnesium transporter [Candidatus Niyogibacteria bacterium]
MEIQPKKEYVAEDDTKESVEHLIERRVPWLFVGLLGGILATLIISKYEAILSADVRLAFFIPVIVYLSDAVGTQTETIYVRALTFKKTRFWTYIFKESVVGVGLGIIFGLILAVFAAYWLKSSAIGFVIGLTFLINLSLAPILAVIIPSVLYKRHSDPALGSGPVATIIQDLISLLVYFTVVSIIIF